MFIRTEKSIKEFIEYYPVVSTLIILNLALWIFVYVLPFQYGQQLFQWGAGHNLSVHEYGEYWRLITPIFLHGGFTHVLFNSFALVLFGPALEQMLGRYKFIFAYLITGIAGNIGTYVMDPLSPIPHIGASGAIYGLFGIYIFMTLFRKRLIDPGNAQIVVIIFLIGFVMTFINTGINIYAHIFGFIGGFAIGPLVLINAEPFSMYRNHRTRKRPRQDGSPQFNPNRWAKKRSPIKVKNVIWIVIGVLVILGLLGRFF